MFLYCWLKKLRNQPSQILLSLVIALFFGQLLFFFGVNFTKSKTICIFIASVTHYSFLVAFFCINVMAFDFCRTFFSSVPISRNHRRCLFSSEDFSPHHEDEISDQVQVVQLLLLGPAIGSCGDRSFARPYVKVGLRSFYLLTPVQPRLPGRLQAQVRKPSLLVQQQEGPRSLLCSAPWCRCPRELCTLPIYYLWHSHTAQGCEVELPIFVILFTSLFKVDLGVLGWDWKQWRG